MEANYPEKNEVVSKKIHVYFFPKQTILVTQNNGMLVF
jgi:hypothetical protein